MSSYCVYILTNKSGTLYIGVTGNLPQRLIQHRNAPTGSFTARYKINQLVYVEETRYIWAALEREKELKAWSRARKLELIREANPTWRDLSLDIIGDARELG